MTVQPQPAAGHGLPALPDLGQRVSRAGPAVGGARRWAQVGVADGVRSLRSGLTHEAHRKEVEQVYLRCSAGTVEWMYPTGALIVNLRPNTFAPSRHLTLCIKPLPDSSGANIYLEKTGELQLLVRDGDPGPGRARCFGLEHWLRPALLPPSLCSLLKLCISLLSPATPGQCPHTQRSLRTVCTPSELSSDSSVQPPVKPSCAEGRQAGFPCPLPAPVPSPASLWWPLARLPDLSFSPSFGSFYARSRVIFLGRPHPGPPLPQKLRPEFQPAHWPPPPRLPREEGRLVCPQPAHSTAVTGPIPMNNCFQTASPGTTSWIFHAAPSDSPCRPCSDTEVLLAVCTSDFVVRGTIQNVTHEPERQESAIHLRVSRLYRQKNRVFRPAPAGEGGGWRGRVTTLLECGARPGPGEFLFAGHMHFGEARLGCAPRFEDFRRVYRDAEGRGLNPCEMGVE
ncbi:meteorin-like protein [Pteropus alecto]|uniref:meteorin-like protein n=1 Tax=Pteropus alecto TaxID=9402 RepID=UPI000D538459|nr:meteorin-like protein [Pteropus alecto]